ncbi:hypothetical protein [Burkholderia ubonensis]|uniref:hypothetical protein n=1 Tax=Burkholderia ubonensis TaxID=101571 RepID=UPI000B167CC4|nr:hypothetical protein [Burkholderia ubonensis]
MRAIDRFARLNCKKLLKTRNFLLNTEARKALIYKGRWRAGKTPKAVFGASADRA